MFNNTFLKLIRKKSQRTTSNTVFHITNENRKNPVFIQEQLTFTHPLQLEEKGRTRADISRKLSSSKTRLKNHKLDLTKMIRLGKSIKVIERKKKSITNTTKKVLELEKQRKSMVDRRKEQIHYSHIEVIFSITNTNGLKNKQYLKDLNEAGLTFLRSRFKSASIKVSVGHLDQTQPHIHAILEYGNGTNLTQDLNQLYGKKAKQYSDLQIDFNRFIQVHDICNKYDFNMTEVVQGGRKDYLSLPKYKELTKKVKSQARKEVDSIFDNLKYLNFWFLKVPTFESIQKVKNVLLKNISSKLINSQIPALINSLIKRNQELENRDGLYENEVKGLKQKLSKVKSVIASKSLELERYKKGDIQNLKELERKTKEIRILKDELYALKGSSGSSLKDLE